MGADFLVDYLWIKQPHTPNWLAAKEEIELLSDKQLADWCENYFWSLFIEDPASDAIRSELFALNSEIEEIWLNVPRDCLILDVGPYAILITGGMSWGDEPTESYTTIAKWSALPLVPNAAGFYKDD